ncbi:MAG: sialate O-acetylesterase [Muribaculaceae bacterium]|nr:sialate O-acetylesterase [Muribaculaceae bacterium]
MNPLKKTSLLVLFLIISSVVFAKRIKVACIGNSVTYGYLLPDREINAYPFQLQKMLGDSYEVGNFGKSGATLLNKGHRPYMQQQEYKDAMAFGGDIAIIHLGLNDTDPRNWPNYSEDFEKDYYALIDSVKMANPKCKVWICRMSPITDKHPRFKSGTRDWYRQIQTRIEDIAKIKNVGLIDLQAPLYDLPNLLPDALHPDTTGAKIIAETVYSAITGNYGGLKMSPVYSDNMVLQHNTPIEIKGVANAGDEVIVKIAGKKYKAICGENGKWGVTIKPLKAGSDYTLSVSTKDESLTYSNVAAGEVWLCSGQSNMAFMVWEGATAKEDVANANNSNIRFFNLRPAHETNNVEWNVSFLDSLNRLDYYKPTEWQVCSGETVNSFSAVAYHFGRVLADSLDIPVGLICNAIGGSATESWISREIIEEKIPDILVDWTKNDMVQDWVRGRAELNCKKSTVNGQRHPYEPTYLYAVNQPIIGDFTVKGMIWYQGESNAHNIELHEQLFPMVIESWREQQNNPDMPFYFVQLSSINRPSWCNFRNSQRIMSETLHNVGMAVSSDKGDEWNVHPTHKKEIGERLARVALNKSYEMRDIVPSGPMFRSVTFEGGIAYPTFEYGEGLQAEDGGEIIGFEVAGDDKIFYPANAEVKNGKLKVWSKEVKAPKYIRYGWQPYTTANLINKECLPASTFKN